MPGPKSRKGNLGEKSTEKGMLRPEERFGSVVAMNSHREGITEVSKGLEGRETFERPHL